MKKVLLLFITAAYLLPISSYAQKAKVGLTGGVSVTNVYGNLNNMDTRGEARAGYTAGLVVDAPIGKSNFSFQPGIHYVQKGKFTLKNEAVREADALRYADLILNFILHAGKRQGAHIIFGLGPQLGFNLPSKKISVEDNERRELRSITFGNTAANDYRGIDWGANGLVGVMINKCLGISVNYTFGIRNLVPEERINGDDHLRNGATGIRVTYFFPNTSIEQKNKK
jgi:hypothetical protein